MPEVQVTPEYYHNRAYTVSNRVKTEKTLQKKDIGNEKDGVDQQAIAHYSFPLWVFQQVQINKAIKKEFKAGKKIEEPMVHDLMPGHNRADRLYADRQNKEWYKPF